jgi:alpha-2-macroglobulin
LISFIRLRLAFIIVTAASGTGAQTPMPLRVVRVTPSADASPAAQITVSFDRPVAGSLDRTVDPETVLHVEPPISGKIEWRDPVTIRLVPARLLAPGAAYTVTISTDFRAMDGSALATPYRFTFRIPGPTLLGGTPVGFEAGRSDVDIARRRVRNVATDQRFELLYSAPVDLEKLSHAAYLEFSASCSTQRIVRLRATGQRQTRADWRYLARSGRDNSTAALDSMRRLVQLSAESPLPRACPGDLVAPLEMDDQLSRGNVAWSFETHGDFRIADLRCDEQPVCPRGPLEVRFTTPVSGAEVMRHVHLIPDAPFTLRDTLGESTSWTLEARLAPRVGYAVVADTTIRDIFGQPLLGNPAAGVRTTGYPSSINHAYGHLLVERVGYRTLSVQHVNVDTLVAVIAGIPDSLEPRVLSRFGWANDSVWAALARTAATQRIPVRAPRDRAVLTNVHLPVPSARRAGDPLLYAVRITGRTNGTDSTTRGPIAVVQVTDLGVHARIGATEGVVWVTGVNDGSAKAGASVVLYDVHGRGGERG